MMVVPAQRGQIVRIMATAVAAMFEVMNLEPVPRPAPRDGAATVPPHDKAADSRRDSFGVTGGNHRFAVVQADELYRPGTQRLLEYLRRDPGAELDLTPNLPTTVGHPVEVGKQHHIGSTTLTGIRIAE
ncbi:MAG: hypothetical protein WBV06_06175 [Acidimicrobiia bacterium]